MISNPDLDSNFDYSVVVELRKAALETPLTQLPVSSPIKILQPGILNMGVILSGSR